jgi:hypothetical protein
MSFRRLFFRDLCAGAAAALGALGGDPLTAKLEAAVVMR